MAWFNSFSTLGECAYFHFTPSPNALFFVACLLQHLLISFLAFSSALNFIPRLLLHPLFSFAAFSYKVYWRYLNVMVWMFPFSFHLPNCILPYLWSCPPPPHYSHVFQPSIVAMSSSLALYCSHVLQPSIVAMSSRLDANSTSPQPHASSPHPHPSPSLNLSIWGVGRGMAQSPHPLNPSLPPNTVGQPSSLWSGRWEL